MASRRAQARPTTPAPTTTQSTRSIRASARPSARSISARLTPRLATAARMSARLLSSIGTPSARRRARARRSGSPGSRISSKPGAGGDALTQSPTAAASRGDVCRFADGGRVEDEGQHAVDDAVLARVVRGDGRTAGQRAHPAPRTGSPGPSPCGRRRRAGLPGVYRHRSWGRWSAGPARRSARLPAPARPCCARPGPCRRRWRWSPCRAPARRPLPGTAAANGLVPSRASLQP